MDSQKTVVVHPTTKKKALNDICPKCGGELDTGWECNDCGYDAIWIVQVDVGLPRS